MIRVWNQRSYFMKKINRDDRGMESKIILHEKDKNRTCQRLPLLKHLLPIFVLNGIDMWVFQETSNFQTFTLNKPSSVFRRPFNAVTVDPSSFTFSRILSPPAYWDSMWQVITVSPVWDWNCWDVSPRWVGYYNIPDYALTKIPSSAQDLNPIKHAQWRNFGLQRGHCQAKHTTVQFADHFSQIWQ